MEQSEISLDAGVSGVAAQILEMEKQLDFLLNLLELLINESAGLVPAEGMEKDQLANTWLFPLSGPSRGAV